MPPHEWRASRCPCVVVHGENDDAALDLVGLEAHEGVETAQPWHREIRDNDVRPQAPGGVDERIAVAHSGDDVEIGVLQAGRSRPSRRIGWMVIGDEDGVSAQRTVAGC